MLYNAYQARQDFLAPWRIYADLTAAVLREPMAGPWGNLFVRTMGAAAELVARSGLTHERPSYDIADIKLQYFGRDDGADASVAPTWRDRWDSRQTLPLEIRIDVTPARGSAWPTIYASPRNAPEAGCRGYDYNRQRCVSA